MNKKHIAPVTALALALPALAAAQGVRAIAPAEQDKRAIEGRAAAGGGGRLLAAVETRVTPGRPYSAEAVTESQQVLGDGNRIARKTTVRVFRDSDGRTRREQSGPAGETITIWDPVASASFTLHPDKKPAYRGGLVALKSPAPGVGGGRGAAGGDAAVAPTFTPPKSEEGLRSKESAARVEMSETSRVASGQMRQVLELAASGGGKTTKEELGTQNIEGVTATGTRATTVIPAGAIGNVQEIRIVSEQWFSPDLEVLVLTRHSDPRVGETVYRLTNIVRGQPDPALFSVPADYTVVQRLMRQPQ